MKKFESAEIHLFLAIIALIIIPLVLICAYESELGIFRFLAGDSFYYLAMAKNSQDSSFFSYDGTYATNGFHPLWQWVLWAVWKIVPHSDPGDFLLAIFSLSSLLTSIGAGLWGVAVRRATGSSILGLLAGVPGFHFLMFALVDPHVGSTWSFANGMESGLSMALFAAWYLFFWQAPKKNRQPINLYGILVGAAFMTISRLDTIFIFVPTLILIFLIKPWKEKSAFFYVLLPMSIAIVIVALPLMHNLIRAGMLMPVSGAVKSGIHLAGNLHSVIYSLMPLPGLSAPSGLAWETITWRVLLLLVPVIASLIWLFRFKKSIQPSKSWSEDYVGRPETWAMAMLASFVVLKGTYHFVFTEFYHQGHWYFPLHLMIFSLLISFSISTSCTSSWLKNESRLALGLVMLSILFMGYAVVKEKRITTYNVPYYQFWTKSSLFDQLLDKEAPNTGLVEFDDGILAYSLKAPSLNAFGFAVDLEALRAMKERRFLRLAWKRGHRILASLTSLPALPPSGANHNVLDQYCRKLFFKNESWESWQFKVLIKDPHTGCCFISFTPEGDWDN